MLIYRVENKNGDGMYHSPERIDWLSDQFDDRLHPEPKYDSELMRQVHEKDMHKSWYDRHMHYGFSSIDQLKRWLYADEVKDQLAAAGFAVSVYKVPDNRAAAGDTQAVFFLYDAHKINSINIKEV